MHLTYFSRCGIRLLFTIPAKIQICECSLKQIAIYYSQFWSSLGFLLSILLQSPQRNAASIYSEVWHGKGKLQPSLSCSRLAQACFPPEASVFSFRLHGLCLLLTSFSTLRTSFSTLLSLRFLLSRNPYPKSRSKVDCVNSAFHQMWIMYIVIPDERWQTRSSTNNKWCCGMSLNPQRSVRTTEPSTDIWEPKKISMPTSHTCPYTSPETSLFGVGWYNLTKTASMICRTNVD